MMKRYIAFLSDNTEPSRQVVTTRLIFARTPYGAKRLAKIAARSIFDNYGYNVNIHANVWPMDAVEKSAIKAS